MTARRGGRPAAALVLLLAAGGCSGRPASAPVTTTGATGTATTGATGTATSARTARTTDGRTTSTLGPMPPVLSSGPSPVDGTALRSLADLPAAFQCPSAVPAITLPATADAPPALVCSSRIAADEAIFLWYAGDPDERYRAVRAALAKAKYVRAGATWVAGGMRDPEMGGVGGEVYR